MSKSSVVSLVQPNSVAPILSPENNDYTSRILSPIGEPRELNLDSKDEFVLPKGDLSNLLSSIGIDALPVEEEKAGKFGVVDPDSYGDKFGMDGLHDAIREKDFEVIRSFAARDDVDVNLIGDYNGLTPLHHAALYGHLETVQALIDVGADAKMKDRRGTTSLHYAVMSNHEKDDEEVSKILTLLVDNGADIKASDESGTALHIAARRGSNVLTGSLLALDASIDAINKDGFTPLAIAAFYGHKKIVEKLLAAGADPFITPNAAHDDRYEISLSDFIESRGHHEIAEMIRGYEIKLDDPTRKKAQASPKPKAKTLSPTPAAIAAVAVVGGSLVGGPVGALALGLGAVALVGFGVRQIIKYNAERRAKEQATEKARKEVEARLREDEERARKEVEDRKMIEEDAIIAREAVERARQEAVERRIREEAAEKHRQEAQRQKEEEELSRAQQLLLQRQSEAALQIAVAQQKADRIRADATAKAAQKISEAQEKAAQLVSDAQMSLDEVRPRTSELDLARQKQVTLLRLKEQVARFGKEETQQEARGARFNKLSEELAQSAPSQIVALQGQIEKLESLVSAGNKIADGIGSISSGSGR